MEHAEIDIDLAPAWRDGWWQAAIRLRPGTRALRLSRPLAGPHEPIRGRYLNDGSTANNVVESMIVTASLTTDVARVTHGMAESVRLVDEILEMDHLEWETTLYIGDVEFHRTKDGGPFPNHQLRISVRPSAGLAALNYMDHDDPHMPIANSFNPKRPLPGVDLTFNGTTGAVFPRTAVIPIADARKALIEWLKTRKRPTCIEWRPYDLF